MKLPFLAVVGLTAAVASGADHKPVLWRPSGKKDHDPWKKFCGSTPCWDVLEVPFGATEEQVKKSYRKLAREWHPDKNPEKGARAKFQKIAKAYEVLSTDGEKAKYERMMANPEEYRKEYGVYFFKVVAPPSDLTLVILLLLVIASAIHYTILKQKKTEYNGAVIKMTVENRGPTNGGTVETQNFHREALARFGNKSMKPKSLNDSTEFKAAVVAVLSEANVLMVDPKLTDLAGVKVFTVLPQAVLFQLSWFFRHTVQGQPLNDEEKDYLLSRAVGEWDSLSASKKDAMREAEVWDADNLAKWRAKHSKKSS